MGSEGAVSTPLAYGLLSMRTQWPAAPTIADATVMARLPQANVRRRRPPFDEAPKEELWAQ